MNHLDNSKHQQSNVDERLKKKKNGNKKSDEEKVEREKNKINDGDMYRSIEWVQVAVEQKTDGSRNGRSRISMQNCLF